MKQVIWVVGQALGHVARSLVVADALVAAGGVAVTFVSSASREFAAELLRDRHAAVILPKADAAAFGAALGDVVAGRPCDLMVFDCNPARWLRAFRRPPVPSAMLTNVFLTGAAGLRTQQVEAAARQGEAAARAVYDLYEMDRVLLADPVPLARRFDPLPDRYRACGAVAWSPDDPLPEALRDARDLLLVSMGSSGRRPLSARQLDEIAAIAGCREVVVAGTAFGPVEGASVRVRHFERLPLRRLLPQVRLALTSGGAGSTYLALEAGVPTAVWPSHRNHEILGEIIEDMGLGFLVREGEEPAARLAAGLEAARAAARGFAPAASSRDGAAAAAAELRAMLR